MVQSLELPPEPVFASLLRRAPDPESERRAMLAWLRERVAQHPTASMR